MITRARAPLRLGLAGGGTDVAPYAFERGGAVLNATIDRYATVSIEPAERPGIEIYSIDYDVSVHTTLEDDFIYGGQLDLLQTVVEFFVEERHLDRMVRTKTPKAGIRILVRNDAPPGSGLGSSSAIVVALVAALNRLTGVVEPANQLAELAFRLERDKAGIAGGRQDQYSAAFGGLNFLEFGEHGTAVNNLQLMPWIRYELEYAMVHAYVGGQHNSGEIIQRQVRNYVEKNKEAVSAMDDLVILAREMKVALLQGDIDLFGTRLDESWERKKRMADGISTPAIDAVYDAAKEAGALGGKLSGAGGGGFMLFIVQPQKRLSVERALVAAGAELTTVHLTQEGVTTWSR